MEFTQTIVIEASPVVVWRAITDPELVAQYHLARLKVFEPQVGGRIVYGSAEADMIVGGIVRIEPDARLDHTFRFEGHEGAEGDAETMVSYRLEGVSEGTKLTLVHGGFAEENQTYANVCGGWPVILEGLREVAAAR